jgi:DNA polymerase III alpha subunit (gram-positive type)
LLAIDFETTGVDVNNDRVIEVGAALWSTSQNKCLESAGFLVKADKPISEDITKLTGITQAAVNKFGFDSRSALENIYGMMDVADAWIGQNVLRFDSKILKSWTNRENYTLPDKLWIDTMYDLPGVESKHLGYMAADAGFLNMFPHSALADCYTVLKLVSMHDIEKVTERAKSPLVILQAHQKRDQNELAKKAKFRWSPDFWLWWKPIKELDMKTFGDALSFDVSVLNDAKTTETLLNS